MFLPFVFFLFIFTFNSFPEEYFTTVQQEKLPTKAKSNGKLFQ